MTDYSELQRAAEAVKAMDYPWEHTIRDGRLGKTCTQYARLAHPSNVLALITENGRLERNRDMWKSQVERQAEEITALRAEATSWKDTLKFNEGCWSEERGAMIDKLQESRMRIKELDLLFGRYILAMRAALIEEEHGLGAEGAMMWIYNSLVGPGELPPENETLAQAYFDREIVAVDNGMQEVLAFHDARRAAKEPSHG